MRSELIDDETPNSSWVYWILQYVTQRTESNNNLLFNNNTPAVWNNNKKSSWDQNNIRRSHSLGIFFFFCSGIMKMETASGVIVSPASQ